MPAADNQRKVRLDLVWRAEKRREQMTFEMIDREVWFALSQRQPFRERRPDHERTGETWAAGRGEDIHVVQREIRCWPMPPSVNAAPARDDFGKQPPGRRHRTVRGRRSAMRLRWRANRARAGSRPRFHHRTFPARGWCSYRRSHATRAPVRLAQPSRKRRQSFQLSDNRTRRVSAGRHCARKFVKRLSNSACVRSSNEIVALRLGSAVVSPGNAP